uniref:VWFA domain-containing protein n=1 Tax=Panagrolaimus sp. JU765 TaxID=591449 RepID=A0AC34QGE3_9BILA
MDLNRAMTTGYVFLTKQNPKIRPVLVLVTKNATDTDWEKAASVASHLKNGLNVAIIVLTTKAANSIVFQKLKKIASPGMAFELPNVKPDNVLSAFSDAACFCNNGQQFIFGEDHPTYFADCFGIFTENVNAQ